MIADTAKIHPSAQIGEHVQIGDYTIIGPDVIIGDNTIIGPHVVLQGPTTLGKDNHIFQFASIGEAPQDKKYAGEKTRLEIGDRNVFREFTTVSRGTVQGGGLTKIGHDNLFMAYVHIAHDCIIDNHVTFSNNASLAGHVRVYDHANLGGFVGVHQFCAIGAYSFCAGGSIIVQDVMPYMIVSGHPAQEYGLNLVGIKRHGFKDTSIAALKRAYKTIFKQGLTFEQAIEKIKVMANETPEVEAMVSFAQGVKRGIVR